MKFATLVILVFYLSSCATVFTGTRDEILFTSQPAGATVSIDGYDAGVTPVRLNVRRNLGQRWVTYTLDGYEEENHRLQKEFNFASIINLTCLGCWVVDLAIGSVTKFEEKEIHMDLVPVLRRKREDIDGPE